MNALGTVTISTDEYLQLIKHRELVLLNGAIYFSRTHGCLRLNKTEFAELVAEEQNEYKEQIKKLEVEKKEIVRQKQELILEAVAYRDDIKNLKEALLKKKGWFSK